MSEKSCATCQYRKYKDEMYPCNSCVVLDGKTLFYTLWRDGEPLTPPETCEWTYTGHYADYVSGCGVKVEFDSSVTVIPDFKFCPYCGREIKEKEDEGDK